jgi:hypothetical protein
MCIKEALCIPIKKFTAAHNHPDAKHTVLKHQPCGNRHALEWVACDCWLVQASDSYWVTVCRDLPEHLQALNHEGDDSGGAKGHGSMPCTANATASATEVCLELAGDDITLNHCNLICPSPSAPHLLTSVTMTVPNPQWPVAPWLA